MSSHLFEFSPNLKFPKDSKFQNLTSRFSYTELPPDKKGKSNQVSKTKNLNSTNSYTSINPIQAINSKQSKKSSYLVKSTNSVPVSEHLRNSSSVTRARIVTVNDLLLKTEPAEQAKTERNEDESFAKFLDKWQNLQGKTKEVLSKLALRKFEKISLVVQDSCNDCLSNTNLSEIMKLNLADHFYLILQNLRSAGIELIGIKQAWKSDMDVIRQENIKLKDEVLACNEKVLQQTPARSPPPKKLPKLQSNELIKSQFEIEKAKLNEKVSLLESHLSNISTQSKVESLSSELQKYKDLCDKYKEKNEKLNQKIKTLTYKFQNELGEVKTKSAEDKEFVKKYSDISTSFTQTILRLEKEKSCLKDEKNQEHERLQMLFEDFTRVQGYREKFKRLQEQSNTLRHKYNQLEMEVISGNSQKRSESSTVVSFAGPLFEKLSNMIPFPESLETYTYSNTQSFRLSSPTFAGLLDLTDSHFSLDPQFSNWLEVHIRGIYDSKYIEHLLSTPASGRVPTRFPDFVYTWLGKFCVDDKSRQVIELEWWKRETIETIRVKFLSILKNSNVNKVWELYTFQEFLNEELMLDELSFYLHCRQLVFKGPQLHTAQGKYSSLNYVEQLHLYEIIDNVLHKLKPSDRLDIKTQLAAKAKYVSEVSCIEVGFVLRLLVEFYVREKKAKFLGLSQTWLMAPLDSAGHISFKSFCSICTGLYPEVTESLIIKMYKLAWAISKGNITCSSFLVAAHEHSFFYFALQLRGNSKPIKLLESGEFSDLKEHRSIKEAYELYQNNKQIVSMIKETVKGLGIPDWLDNINRLEDLIQRKFQEPLEYYNGSDLPEIFAQLWKQVIQVMLVYQETYKTYLPDCRNNSDLVLATETFTNCMREILLNRVHTKVAIRKIQKAWKLKAKKAVAVAATVIKSITKFKRKIKK